MEREIEQSLDAYHRHHVLDNELTLNWYPGRVLKMAPRGKMLELGLGHGISAKLFSEAYSRYVVIEGSAEMIVKFKREHALLELEIVQSYFEEFETAEKFDVIGMGFVLEHVDDPAALLRRYAQFLAPGGSIFIAVPNAESLHRRFGAAAGLLPELTALSAADIEFGHQRYYTLASLRALVSACNLEIAQVEGLFLKPVTTAQLQQLDLGLPVLEGMLHVGVAYPELCNSILLQAQLPSTASAQERS